MVIVDWIHISSLKKKSTNFTKIVKEAFVSENNTNQSDS